MCSVYVLRGVSHGFKVWRTWRIRKNYFGVNETMHVRRIRGKNLCAYGEYSKKLLAYSPYAPRDIKLSISQFIMEQNEKHFRFFISIVDGFE
jgi:hypothetical protein